MYITMHLLRVHAVKAVCALCRLAWFVKKPVMTCVLSAEM